MSKITYGRDLQTHAWKIDLEGMWLGTTLVAELVSLYNLSFVYENSLIIIITGIGCITIMTLFLLTLSNKITKNYLNLKYDFFMHIDTYKEIAKKDRKEYLSKDINKVDFKSIVRINRIRNAILIVLFLLLIAFNVFIAMTSLQFICMSAAISVWLYFVLHNLITYLFVKNI